MKVNNKFYFIKWLLFVNLFYYIKSSTIHINNEESSGMDTNLISLDNTWNQISKYEENIAVMEEKIKSLSETFNQLEQKISILINDNMDLLEKNIRKVMDEIVEEKIRKIDQLMEKNFELITKTKSSYNIQEIKCSNDHLPKSCYDLITCQNNIYNIMIPELSTDPFPAVCDLKTLDGGWTIIQRRMDGSENFYRNWTDYVSGFGNLNGEFFIGLEKLHALTSLEEPQELYIILEDFEGERKYAHYKQFKVDSNSTNYKLTVGEYSGNAGDCFSLHSGHKFSTRDHDNDVSKHNCAERWKGAWWYTDCFYSNLNGMYLAGKLEGSKKRGVAWCEFRKYGYSLKFVQMMIRTKTD